MRARVGVGSLEAEVRRQGLEGSNLRLIDSEPGALAAA